MSFQLLPGEVMLPPHTFKFRNPEDPQMAGLWWEITVHLTVMYPRGNVVPLDLRPLLIAAGAFHDFLLGLPRPFTDEAAFQEEALGGYSEFAATLMLELNRKLGSGSLRFNRFLFLSGEPRLQPLILALYPVAGNA